MLRIIIAGRVRQFIIIHIIAMFLHVMLNQSFRETLRVPVRILSIRVTSSTCPYVKMIGVLLMDIVLITSEWLNVHANFPLMLV